MNPAPPVTKILTGATLPKGLRALDRAFPPPTYRPLSPAISPGIGYAGDASRVGITHGNPCNRTEPRTTPPTGPTVGLWLGPPNARGDHTGLRPGRGIPPPVLWGTQPIVGVGASDQ